MAAYFLSIWACFTGKTVDLRNAFCIKRVLSKLEKKSGVVTGTIIIFCMCLTKCQTRLKVGLTWPGQKPRTQTFRSQSEKKNWVWVVSRLGYEASHARPVRSPVCVIYYVAGLLLWLVDPEIHRQVLPLGIQAVFIYTSYKQSSEDGSHVRRFVVWHSHAGSVWCSHWNCHRTCWSWLAASPSSRLLDQS